MTGRPFAWLAALALAACAARGPGQPDPLGEPLARIDPQHGYRFALSAPARRRDDLLVVVSFSGGGKRAAALAYGVLEQFAADRIHRDGGERRMLDEIDVLSAVSGGSVTAAWYALRGERLFGEFPQRFLEHDVQADLRHAIFFNPRNWFRLASANYSRGDLYADYFAHRMFGDATFADLARAGEAPFVLVNATELGTGGRLEFTQDTFDQLCIDLDRFPLGRAVAASSAFPVVVAPLTLRNRAGQCGYELPAWIGATLASGERSTREYQHAYRVASWQQPERFRYLHLVDGALADNLGIRPALDAVMVQRDPQRLRDLLGIGPGTRIAFVIVNAAGAGGEALAQRRRPPRLAEVARLTSTVPVDRYSLESRVLLEASLRRWAQALGSVSGSTPVYHVEVEFDALADPTRRDRLRAVPTSLSLPKAVGEDIRCAARELLAGSAEYRRLLADLGGGAPAEAPACRR